MLGPSAAPIGIIGATRGSILLGETDPEVETERLGELVVEERAEAAAVDPAHDLAHEVPVGERVVAVRDAGLPVGRLHLERVDHRLPRQRLLAVSLASTVGNPAWWLSSQRTGMCSLPAWPNSGQ